MSTLESADLAERADEALADEYLRAAVRTTVERLREGKRASTQELGDWDAWRERARAIRAHVLANLDAYLDRFASACEAAGGRVHFAADAAEASAIVVGIARAAGAKLVAKSKSMVGEEIGVSAALEERGIEALETDLGEWIVQLAAETPSHIILPAIHKSRADVRGLFQAHAGRTLAGDTKSLAAYARAKLRERFLEADVGFSGANFAIAETGSIALFTNEGNGRMVTSLPRVHVVALGMERVLPSLADLEALAMLLPRSATRQKITTYLSLITGPRRDGELDGPDELHVVVVDNGRARTLGDESMRDVLACIRCGACLNVCPVYRQIGGHAYGGVYPGPIGAVLTPLLDGALGGAGEGARELAQASSLCGACTEACPVAIPLDEMLVRARERRVELGEAGVLRGLAARAAAFVLSNERAFELAGGAVRAAGSLAASVGPLARWSESREAPRFAKRSFRELWSDLEREGGDA